MTNVDWSASPFGEQAASPATEPAANSLWPRIEAALERASEWLNPILVKEARQALKSRQFMITFSLLLIFGWGWSLAGVAMLSQAAYYAPGGRFMLTGYFLILAVPLIVIVPFSAFRSLAAEREDGTFEILSITTLQSRQIISGKLGSAVAQIAVYYSALAPCIAFTYLLRGIDVLTIALMLFYAFVISVLLSQLGLLVATLTRSPQWQILLSVLLILFLAWCDFIISLGMVNLLYETGPIEFDNFYFWVVQFAVLTFVASFFFLFLLAAAAQISFASDNRSTKLRIAMLVQQLLWVGWMTYGMVVVEEAEILHAIAPVAAVYWFLMGSLLSGEDAQLSPRVRRSLPQSFLGRSCFTWFNPGSGTGYVFAVLNLWTVVCAVVAGAVYAEVIGDLGNKQVWEIATPAILCGAYVTAYLGVGRLLLLGIRRRMPTGLLLPLLLNVVIALLGIFLPLVGAGWAFGFSNLDYGALQAPNWAWSITEAVEGNLWSHPLVPLIVFPVAGGLLLVNLIAAMREVEQVRLATPQRVIDDEWELHPEKIPHPHPRSPWDAVEG